MLSRGFPASGHKCQGSRTAISSLDGSQGRNAMRKKTEMSQTRCAREAGSLS